MGGELLRILALPKGPDDDCQFYQVGAECFGDAGPGCDAEMIDALVGFLVEIGIPKPDVFINGAGPIRPAARRPRYRARNRCRRRGICS